MLHVRVLAPSSMCERVLARLESDATVASVAIVREAELDRGSIEVIVSDLDAALDSLHDRNPAAWGHVKIVRDGRKCRCGGRGCVEAYLGADAILEAWRTAGGVFEGTGWGAVGQLLTAAQDGDAVASAVVDELVATLGSALGSLVNLTNPARVVVGGWVGLRLMESLAARIEQSARTESLDRPGAQFELVACRFGGDTVAIGAAMMPLEALLDAPRGSRLSA